MYANQTWDDEKNDRERAVQSLHEFYDALRHELLGDDVDEQEDVPDEHRDAFLRASKRNMAAAATTPELPGEGTIRGLPD